MNVDIPKHKMNRCGECWFAWSVYIPEKNWWYLKCVLPECNHVVDYDDLSDCPDFKPREGEDDEWSDDESM